jgi:hypothetical protein
MQFRQGDLLFVRQDVLPSGLTARPGLVILAGETTDHAHRVTAGTVLDAPDGTIWLHLTTPAAVVHEEHGPITLAPGPWLVVRQREYSPEAIRPVID